MKETQPESWAFKCPNFPFLDLNIRIERSNKGEMKETKTIRICRIIPVAKLPDWRQWNIAAIYSAYQVLILLHLEHSSLGLGNCHFLWDDPGQYFHLKSTRNNYSENLQVFSYEIRKPFSCRNQEFKGNRLILAKFFWFWNLWSRHAFPTCVRSFALSRMHRAAGSCAVLLCCCTPQIQCLHVSLPCLSV